MKKISVILAMFFTLSAQAKLGDKIGNGGGLWACIKAGQLEKAELVDLFEAKTEFKLNIPVPESNDPMRIYAEKKEWVRSEFPSLHIMLEPYFSSTEKSMNIVNAELRIVDDLLSRINPLPEDCAGGKWEYKQFANFTYDGNLLIQKSLWESAHINPLDKAALLIHEGVYHMLREKYNDLNSVRTRKIVGYLFSNLSPEVMRQKIGDLLPPISNPGGGNGTIDDRLGFFLKTTNTQVFSRLHKADAAYGKNIGTGNFNTDCRINRGATGAAADILCVLEVEELDLYFNSLDIQTHVPSYACDYLRFNSYHFYQFEAGLGPITASYAIEDGRIIDGENTIGGEPTCKYDYTSKGGPNCCEGEYTLKVKSSDGIDTYKREWGGSAGFCLAGPATQTQTRNEQGFPLSTIHYISEIGYNRIYSAPASIGNRNSNINIANYYNPGDYLMKKPVALLAPKTILAPNKYTPSDTYEWSCLDRAEDLVARIRLVVREWNSSHIEEGNDPRLGDSSRKTWQDIVDQFPEMDL